MGSPPKGASPFFHLYDMKKKKGNPQKIALPFMYEGHKNKSRQVLAYTALPGKGLLIAMEEGRRNFYIHNPTEDKWVTCEDFQPLPGFVGKTVFAVMNGRFYIFDESSSFLCVYNFEEGRVLLNKIIWEIVALKPLGSHSFHLVPVAEDTLCLLWNVPQGSEQQPGHHIRCFKLAFSEKPRPIIQVLAQHIFRMESARLCDAMSFPYNENCVAGSGGFFQVRRAKWQKRWRKKSYFKI